MLLMPVISFLLIGIFSFVNLSGNVFADKNGGGFFVGSDTTLNFNATISGSSATNGGGVYVSNGGTFNMNGGAIYGNTATANGNNIYNAGTFTMNGGRVGTSGSSSSGYGIYNTGTMNLYGGNVYDNIYSSANINTKMACNIAGTITLGDSATITVQNYAGTTPNYAINLSNARTAGTILTFVGSSTEPNLTKLNISGYDTNAFEIVSEKNSSGNWTVILQEPVKEYDFPSDWKTQVASATYMTTTITPTNLTGIQFVKKVPTGFTNIGTLSTGLPVYQGTTSTEIAFVGGNIKAPYSSGGLFERLSALTSINFSAFSTSNVTNMSRMFFFCKNLTSLDLSKFSTSNVTNMYSMFIDCNNLTSLDLSKFNTSKVTHINFMFQGCESLTSLDLSNFDTSNVFRMEAMFNNCKALTNLDLSNFNTTKVTDMSNMFSGCSGLTSLNLSSFDMTNVGTYDSMLNFGSTGKLKELKTPYNNTAAIPIKTGSTLYNVETGAVVTTVPANTTASKTYATQLTLTFDANGGTCNTTSATAYYNVSLHDSGFVFPYPTKSGYMFSGWYQNTSFVGTKLSLDSVFTTNCKFYAKWEEQNQPSGGGSSNSPCYISWEETGSPLVNEVSEDIKRYNNNYTLESIDGFVIISDYNYSSFQDYTLVERLNISHLPIQVYIVELNPEGPNASYINCSNCSLIVAIYVQEYAFGISNTWDAVFFDENEQLFRELAPNAIFWDLRGFCTENFKPEDAVGEPTTEQYKLILGRQVQLCILPENFYLGIDWSLSEAGCVVQNYLFEDVTGDYSFVSSKNNDQNEIYRDLAKFSLNFNQERTIQNILNLNDEKLLETKRKIKFVSNVKKE